MKHLFIGGIVAMSAVALFFGCGGGGPVQPEYSTTPTTKPVTVTVDAEEFFEVVQSSVEKTAEGYVGKATLKALRDIGAEEIGVVYKPTVWTKEGTRELLDKKAVLQGPLKKGETVEVELPFSGEGGEGGRTVNIWSVILNAGE